MPTADLKTLALALLSKANLPLTKKELDSMELAGFGLGHPEIEGAQIVTMFSTSRVAGKVIVLLPGQTLPEHRHVNKGSHTAKEEIVRVVWGKLTLYADGPGDDKSRIPADKEHAYKARTPIELGIGGQHVISPGTAHWFSPGEEGCVLYSFSSAALDSSDVFTDPAAVR